MFGKLDYNLIILFNDDHVLIVHTLNLYRITTTLFCPMNLYLFPYELHKCSIRIASCKSFACDVTTLHRCTIETSVSVYDPC